MSDPRSAFFEHIQNVSEYFGQGFSESDTRVYLIDPVLRLLGYVRPGDLRREVAVPATKEFLDYELYADGKALAIVEAKAMRQSVTDQAAAQCVQYAAVLGVRWCIITNGITWAIYNAHATGPLADKRVATVRLDSDERGLEEAWDVLSLFMRSTLVQASPLAQLLAERVIVDELSRPDSAAVSALRRAIQTRFGERVSPQVVVEVIERWRNRAPASIQAAAEVVGGPLQPASESRPQPASERAARAPREATTTARQRSDVLKPDGTRVRLADLISAGVLPKDAAIEMRVDELTFPARLRDGQVEVNGSLYPNLSQAASAVRSGKSFNGWAVWFFAGRALADHRDDFLRQLATSAQEA